MQKSNAKVHPNISAFTLIIFIDINVIVNVLNQKDINAINNALTINLILFLILPHPNIKYLNFIVPLFYIF